MADDRRSQHQQALADKRKKLEELRARRQQRSTQTVSATETARARISAAANLDNYIDGLLREPATQAAAAAAATTAAPAALAPAAAAAEDKSSTQPMSASLEGGTMTQTAAPTVVVAPAAKTAETFEMSTQTAEDDFPPPSDNDEEEQQQTEQARQMQDGATENNETLAAAAAAVTEEMKREVEAKVLTAEEVERELASETFSSFLNSASKKVERVLGSAVLADLLMDYDGETEGTERASSKASDGSKFLSSRQIYECPKWTATRDITDMDWSPLHRELMLCSYHMPSSTSKLGEPKGSTAIKAVAPTDTPSDSLAPRSSELLSDGLALVWNLAMPNRPEHVFTCGSPVTSARFHPTESPLIIGGCQSGQLVLWDVRAGRMPVQKSSLTTSSNGNSKGHTYPICVMQIIEGGVSITRTCTYIYVCMQTWDVPFF